MSLLANSRPHPNTIAFHVAFISVYLLCLAMIIALATRYGMNDIEYVAIIPFAIFIIRDVIWPYFQTVKTDFEFSPPQMQFMPKYPVRFSKDGTNFAVDVIFAKFIVIRSETALDDTAYNNICGHEYAHIHFYDCIFLNSFKILTYFTIALITRILLSHPAEFGDEILREQFNTIFLGLISLAAIAILYVRKSFHDREYNADFLSMSVNGFSYMHYLSLLERNARSVKRNFFETLSHPTIVNRLKKINNPSWLPTSHIVSLALIYFCATNVSNSASNYLNSFPFDQFQTGGGALFSVLSQNFALRMILIFAAQLSIMYYLCSEFLIVILKKDSLKNATKFVAIYILVWVILLLGSAFIFPEIKAALSQQFGGLVAALFKVTNVIVTPIAMLLSVIVVKTLFKVKRYGVWYVGIALILASTLEVCYLLFIQTMALYF